MLPIVFFAVAAVTAGIAIWLLMYADGRAHRDEILLRLRAGDEDEVVSQVSREAQLKDHPILRRACHIAWRAGSEAEPETVFKVLVILLAMIPVSMLILGFVGGCIVVGFTFFFGLLVLRRRASNRRARIVEQLPAFLEGGLRVLQAGSTLEESLAKATLDTQPPLKPLFQSVTRQTRLGAPLDQVLSEVAEIYGIREIKVIALAAAINRRYGGSLRNVFRSLIAAIRARDSAARELRALTAETRFSAVVLSVIPAVITAYIYFQNRDYYSDMWESTAGRWVLIFVIVWQFVGMYVIYRMMSSTEEDES